MCICNVKITINTLMGLLVLLSITGLSFPVINIVISAIVKKFIKYRYNISEEYTIDKIPIGGVGYGLLLHVTCKTSKIDRMISNIHPCNGFDFGDLIVKKETDNGSAVDIFTTKFSYKSLDLNPEDCIFTSLNINKSDGYYKSKYTVVDKIIYVNTIKLTYLKYKNLYRYYKSIKSFSESELVKDIIE